MTLPTPMATDPQPTREGRIVVIVVIIFVVIAGWFALYIYGVAHSI